MSVPLTRCRREKYSHVGPSRRAEVDHHANNVLSLTQPLAGILPVQLIDASEDIDQSICQLRREEARGDNVGSNVPGPELDGKMPSKMIDCGFGGSIHDSSVLSNMV